MADATATTSPKADTSILVFPPLVHVVFGFMLLIVWLVGNIMSMQTSESFLLSIQNVRMSPDLTIFAQFPQFFTGALSEDIAIAFVFAFVTQMVLLTAKIGLASVHARVNKKHGIAATEAMIKSARARVWTWNVLSGMALILNAVADMVYSGHLGFFQSLFFSAVMFVATFYLGTFGIQNISAGMAGMNA